MCPFTTEKASARPIQKSNRYTMSADDVTGVEDGLQSLCGCLGHETVCSVTVSGLTMKETLKE